jgi:hypothetical protein
LGSGFVLLSHVGVSPFNVLTMIINRLLSFGVGWVEGSRTLKGRSHSAVLCQLSYDPHM